MDHHHSSSNIRHNSNAPRHHRHGCRIPLGSPSHPARLSRLSTRCPPRSSACAALSSPPSSSPPNLHRTSATLIARGRSSRASLPARLGVASALWVMPLSGSSGLAKVLLRPHLRHSNWCLLVSSVEWVRLRCPRRSPTDIRALWSGVIAMGICTPGLNLRQGGCISISIRRSECGQLVHTSLHIYGRGVGSPRARHYLRRPLGIPQ
jgi:hypothetical protein